MPGDPGGNATGKVIALLGLTYLEGRHRMKQVKTDKQMHHNPRERRMLSRKLHQGSRLEVLESSEGVRKGRS